MLISGAGAQYCRFCSQFSSRGNLPNPKHHRTPSPCASTSSRSSRAPKLNHARSPCRDFQAFSKSRCTSAEFRLQFARQLREENVTRPLEHLLFIHPLLLFRPRPSGGVPDATRDIQFPPRPPENEISSRPIESPRRRCLPRVSLRLENRVSSFLPDIFSLFFSRFHFRTFLRWFLIRHSDCCRPNQARFVPTSVRYFLEHNRKLVTSKIRFLLVRFVELSPAFDSGLKIERLDSSFLFIR